MNQTAQDPTKRGAEFHAANGGKGLRLNFRNAPLSLVLDYLSDAAGFTISASAPAL